MKQFDSIPWADEFLQRFIPNTVIGPVTRSIHAPFPFVAAIAQSC